MKRILSAIRPLLMSLILLVSLGQYSWADECAELDCPCPDAADEINRILDGDENVRGEFGLIRDGEYIPYDWRIRWLEHFPKVSAGYILWFDSEWDPMEGPALYFNVYTRPEIKKISWLDWMPKKSEYFIPTSIEAGAGNGIAITKLGWLILPIIDFKVDIGVGWRFEDNFIEEGFTLMVGISMLRL